MSEDYVSKDLFNEALKRLEALNAASEARHEKLTAQVLARFEHDTDTIAEAVSGINTRLDDLNNRPSWSEKLITITFTVMGITVSLAAVIVAGVQVYMSLGGAK